MAKVPEDKALLTVYGGKNITINGKPFKDYDYKGGGMLSGYQLKLTLDPGEYTIAGDYMMTSAGGKVNNRAKNIPLTASLRAGYEYDLGIHTDPAELQIAVAYVELDKRDWNVILRVLED
jgi:hypothetical protein